MDNCTILIIRANPFNEFFSSVFTDEIPDTIPIFTVGRGDLGYLSSINITPDLAFDKLNSLKPGKSPEPDGWPPTFFKKISNSALCSPSVAILFAKSLKSGLLLQNWKTGYIVPIFKKAVKSKLIIIMLNFSYYKTFGINCQRCFTFLYFSE